MSQYYSDESREEETYSLPNVEIFYAHKGELETEDGEKLGKGWYFWYCFPGCMPEGDPMGPYATEEEAETAMREENDQ